MGINSGKKEIIQELQNSDVSKNMKKDLKIEYKINYEDKLYGEDEEDFIEFNDSFDEKELYINNNKLNIKNIKKYPYDAIGTISVQFPDNDEVFAYTCFLIDKNKVVTLASNIENKSKGGKAKSIMTSFSKENVKWENIYIQEEEELNENYSKIEEKNSNNSLNNSSSKLAVIIYNNAIASEWIGIIIEKLEHFDGLDKYVTFSFKEENDSNNININGEKNDNKLNLREIPIYKVNPFLDALIKGEKKDIELISQSPGSPIYFKDYNNGVYSFGIINENFEFQYYDDKTLKFLIDKVNIEKQLKIKQNFNIDVDYVIELKLGDHNLSSSDINFLISNFELKNLRILDLRNNSLKSKGAFYLSQNKFNSLEILNLNNNKIGDQGLIYISKGNFNKLNNLYLNCNCITSEGIKNLVRAEFINNLITLSLSENIKICDAGIKHMKEHKGWSKLRQLNLDIAGLTDVSLDYLSKMTLPKIKKINIRENKFTDYGLQYINGFKISKVCVNYKSKYIREDDEMEN